MSILLPSGESNYVDYNQHREINLIYPSPVDFVEASSIYKTYPKDETIVKNNTGIFHSYGLINPLSNSNGIYVSVTNLNVFGPYVHYYNNLVIPFVSTYKVSLGYNPYPGT